MVGVVRVSAFEPCAVCGVQLGDDAHSYHGPDCLRHRGKRWCDCDGFVHPDCCDHCKAEEPV